VTVTVSGSTSVPVAASLYTYSAAPAITSLSPKKGPAGTSVTIHGANLEEVSQVDFGTTPAEDLEVLSVSEVRVVAPPGTGAVDVTATSPNGTSPTTKKARFKYAK
jgi:hypothetical protein